MGEFVRERDLQDRILDRLITVTGLPSIAGMVNALSSN
jgi:hypothetical protein